MNRDFLQCPVYGRSGPVEYLRSAEEDDGADCRSDWNGRGRMALLELLRLAECAELHPAARGRHPDHQLFYAPESVSVRNCSEKERRLVGRGRSHSRRGGRQRGEMGPPGHQRHGCGCGLLPNRAVG